MPTSFTVSANPRIDLLGRTKKAVDLVIASADGLGRLMAIPGDGRWSKAWLAPPWRQAIEYEKRLVARIHDAQVLMVTSLDGHGLTAIGAIRTARIRCGLGDSERQFRVGGGRYESACDAGMEVCQRICNNFGACLDVHPDASERFRGAAAGDQEAAWQLDVVACDYRALAGSEQTWLRHIAAAMRQELKAAVDCFGGPQTGRDGLAEHGGGDDGPADDRRFRYRGEPLRFSADQFKLLSLLWNAAAGAFKHEGVQSCHLQLELYGEEGRRPLHRLEELASRLNKKLHPPWPLIVANAGSFLAVTN
jgi:hypothetical protein